MQGITSTTYGPPLSHRGHYHHHAQQQARAASTHTVHTNTYTSIHRHRSISTPDATAAASAAAYNPRDPPFNQPTDPRVITITMEAAAATAMEQAATVIAPKTRLVGHKQFVRHNPMTDRFEVRGRACAGVCLGG